MSGGWGGTNGGRSGRTLNDLFEILDSPVRLINLIQSRDLNEPSDIMTEQSIIDDPRRQFIPLLSAASIDTNPILCHLILALFQICHELPRDFGEVSTGNQVIGLEEDLAQARFADRVVF